ncbi:urea ABC transporter permease [Halobacteria archaeon AArc-dxtr1]|nr:urea ABC transporter permease [Halobacteria archaeon AArc-dxtr1]
MTEPDRSPTLGERLRAPFEGPNTLGNSRAFWIGLSVGVLLLALYPVLFGPYAARTVTGFMVFALLGISLCFIWGYCGILSFGQVAFFGVGGYTFGIVAFNLEAFTGVTLGIVVALLVSTGFAAVLGYFMFYGGVREVYVTIITLVVALVLFTFMRQTAGSEWAIGEARLGGHNGMPGIPNLGIGIGETGIEFGDAAQFYVVLGALIGTYLLLRWLVNSRFGYAMVATREDEERTEMFGYNTTFIKFATFTAGGAIAGLGGVLFVTTDNYINPNVFEITAAAAPVIWASIGGRESLIGTAAAAIAIQWFELQLADEWALVMVGSLLVAVILLLPKGMAPAVQDVYVWIQESRSDESSGPPATPEEVTD